MNDVDHIVADRLKAKATTQRELAARPVNDHRDLLDFSLTGLPPTAFAERCVRFAASARDRLLG